ncbi:hypothetical protein [Luteolibacter sp. LG18]|uniref:hypothetical protein n=1 Tax=Luteolibacter sp. LG18 TaxID=2819286 RepID=UPI002B3190B2|nr:hypothetical protein llg_18090 [Luteolibacter sp. LG18]
MATPTDIRTGLGGPSRAHRKYFTRMVGSFVGVMGLFSLVNTWVNPLWVTPSPWTSDHLFADSRQIYRDLRTAKAGLVRSKQWDTVFLGSSRIAIAFDPAMPQWGDHKVVNLGLSGGSLTEQDAFVNYIFEKQKGVKTIYLGVDPTDLTDATDMARNAGFYESPMNPAGDVVEREMRYVTGVSSFIASSRTLKTRFWVELPGDEQKDKKLHPSFLTHLKEAIRTRDTMDNKHLPPYTGLGHWLRDRSVRPVRAILETDSIPHALRMIRQRKAKQEKIADNKVKALAHILDNCLSRGVELKLLLPPNYAAYLAVFHIDNDPDPSFSKVRELVVDMVAKANAAHPEAKPVTVWDFFDFHPLNAEPLSSVDPKTGFLHYWADGTHSLETLGHVMLKRMNGWPIDDPKEADYGREIDVHNVQDRLKEIRAQYQTYRKTYPEDIKWVEEIMSKYASVGPEKQGAAEGEDQDNPTPGQ